MLLASRVKGDLRVGETGERRHTMARVANLRISLIARGARFLKAMP